MEGAIAADFIEAGGWLVELASQVPEDRLEDVGLGVWSVRSLLGHAARSLLTVIEYLGHPAEEVALDSALAYLSSAGRAAPAAIAQRGVAAGRELGDDPATRVAALAEQSARLVRTTPADQLLTTIAGGMRLEDYLPTRTLELVVHGLDLAAAIGSDAEPPRRATSSMLELLVELQVRRGRTAALVLLLSGRATPPGSLELWPSPDPAS